MGLLLLLLEDAHYLLGRPGALALARTPHAALLLEIDLPLVKDKETRETRRLAARRVPNSLLRLKYSGSQSAPQLNLVFAWRRNFFQG
jgi:hypothetical protein